MKRLALRSIPWLLLGVLIAPTLSDQAVHATAPLPSWVFMGDSVSFPIHILEHEGQKKVAKVRIVAPSGKILTDESFVASEAGRYEVHYQATFGDTLVEETETFLSVRHSSDLFQGNGDISFTNQAIFAYDSGYSGVMTNMNTGGRFTFPKVLDMTSFTQSAPLAQFMVEPSTESSADFETLHFSFQDVEDSSQGFSIVVENGGAINGDGHISYLRAGAFNQALSGYERLGDRVTFHNDGTWGTPLSHTFRGLTKEGISKWGYHPITLYYDASQNALYASAPYGQDSGSTLVVDFNEAKAFPTNPWSGFPSGKATMTVWGEGFHSAANVLWTSLGGYDLSKREQQDTSAPKITVDYGKEDGAPNGVVGMAYPVFKASVFDDYDDGLTIDTYVTYHDERYDAAIRIPIQNGKIQIEKAGSYQIHYESSDRSGNKAEEVVSFTAGEAAQDLTVVVPTFETNGTAFESFTLPSLDALRAENAYGHCNFALTVTDPEGNVMTVKDNTFVPEESGTYHASFSAQDYLGRTATKVMDLTIAPTAKPVFLSAPDLPKAYLTGFHYTLPTMEAVETGNDGKAKAVAVKAYRNDTLDDGSSFEASGENLSIRYEAVGVTGTNTMNLTIPVQDGQGGKVKAQYFYGENATIEEVDESMNMTFSAAGEVTFLRSLSNQNFEVLFRIPDDGLNGLFLRFHQNGKAITLHVHAVDDTYVVTYPNSDREITLTNTAGFFGLSYNALNHSLKDGLGKSIGFPSTYDDGSTVDQLNDQFSFSFGFTTLSSSKTLSLTRLSGQPFGHGGNPARAKDRINPIVILANDFAVRQEIGATLTIPSASAYDVLNEVGEVTVSVKNENETLLEETSAAVSHTVTFTKLAKYRVEYKVTDSQGNEGNYFKMIDVAEKEAPTLDVDFNGISSQYHLGDILKLPEATSSDNSGSSYVLAYLLTPKNQTILLYRFGEEATSYVSRLGSEIAVDDMSFRLWEEGTYRLRYVAYDESYNHTAKEVAFTVTKGEAA